MFFKKYCILLLFISFPAFGFLNDLSCRKDIENNYANILDGSLANQEKQERFFRCIEDFLDLVINQHIVYHDPSRDHFTKEEIFKLLNHKKYFNIEKEKAANIVSNLFLIKHIVVGGKRNQLSDQEIKDIHRLIPYYRNFYHVIRKEIPFLRSIFSIDADKRQAKTEQRIQKFLSKFKEGLHLLSKAYFEEQVEYQLADFQYLFNDLSKQYPNNTSFKYYGEFYTAWVQGLFQSQLQIKDFGWFRYTHHLQDLISSIVYYKVYLEGQDPLQAEALPKTLKSLRFLVSSLRQVRITRFKQKPKIEIIKQASFPVARLDEMAQAIHSIFYQEQDSKNNFFSISKETLPFLTRSFICFVLDRQNSCQIQKGSASDSFLVSYQFPDGNMIFNEQHYKWTPKAESFSSFGVSSLQLQALMDWLQEYEEAHRRVSRDKDFRLAREYQFDHLLDSSLGETLDKQSRLVFYPSRSSSDEFVALNHRFLNYRFLSDLFLKPYQQKNSKLSKKDLKLILSELLPIFSVVTNSQYNSKLPATFLNFFNIADMFLHSSNFDGKLDQRELLDSIVHIMSGAANSSYAFERFTLLCPSLQASCISRQLFNQADILKPFPRALNFVMQNGANQYIQNTENFFKNKTIHQKTDLIEFFILLQVMEVTFNKIDNNKDSILSKTEIAQFAKQPASMIKKINPYVHNLSQAQAFIVYSFKTGLIPFLDQKEQNLLAADFLYWSQFQKNSDSFFINKEDFVTTVFNFYNLTVKLSR